MNPRYKFSNTESTLVSEIPEGVVANNVRFHFDRPFIMPPKKELELVNGEWYLVQINREGETLIKQEGMWKENR